MQRVRLSTDFSGSADIFCDHVLQHVWNKWVVVKPSSTGWMLINKAAAAGDRVRIKPTGKDEYPLDYATE